MIISYRYHVQLKSIYDFHFNPNKSYDTVDIFVLYSGLEGSKKPVIQNSNGKFWISAI